MATNSLPIIRKPIVDYLFRYLSSVGADPVPFEQRCEWIEAESEGLEPALSMAQFIALLEEAASLTGDPDLGLHYYQDSDWEDLGLFGFATLHAETVADAIALDCRHSQMVQSHTDFSLDVQPDGKLVYDYRLLAPELPMSRHDNDMAIAGLVYAIRSLTDNPDWVPLRADFMHSQPRDTEGYRQCLKDCPLVFDAPVNRLVIDAACAATPVAGRDSRLFSVLEADLERLHDATDVGLLETVRREVLLNLHQGVLSIDESASRLELSRRSLQRRLADEGYTYKQLVEQLREQLAIQYLGSDSNSLVDIALMLGYSELSAFIRAFRRWTGETPQQYRSKQPD